MRGILKISLLSVSTLLAALMVTLFYLYLHNFYAVIPNEVYRSRELNKEEFSAAIKKYQLRSIINLRGAHPGIRWYDEEIALSKKAAVKHFDIALKSKELPNAAQLQLLAHIIETAPKPLLIHCLSGVDRTGLAAVIALLLKNAPYEEAEKQVSYRYFVTSSKSAGVQLLQSYDTWLRDQNLISTREHFLRWLTTLK